MSYPTRTRSSRGDSSTPAPPVQQMAPPGYRPSPVQYQSFQTPQRVAPPNQYAQAVAYRQMQAPQIPTHPETYPPGPLGFFLPPPGQRNLDPTSNAPPITQGMFTTYPSRLRTGVTSLMQPETVTAGTKERESIQAEFERELAGARSSGASTPRVESPAPSRAGRGGTTTTLSGRRAGRPNYAEKDESEEEESSDDEIEEAASDPDDDDYGSRRRRRDTLDPQTSARIGKIRKKHSDLERGWTWLGDRAPAERVRSEYAKGTKHKFVPEEHLAVEAERPELLVPIAIDYDVPAPNDHQPAMKIKDRFLWNANEPFYKPQDFAVIFCEDVGISTSHAATLADLIQTQVEDYQNTVIIDLATDDVAAEDVTWSDDEGDDHMMVDEHGEKTWPEPDCRIIINLDIQIYTHVLRDRIEWDLSSSLPPSQFAKHYCAELGLTGEAVPLVAHAIHDELIKHKRDALELDLFAHTHPLEQAKWEKTGGGQPITNNRFGAKGLVGVWRDWWERDEYGPVLVELSTEEMVRREQERGREARRMIRSLQTSRRRR